MSRAAVAVTRKITGTALARIMVSAVDAEGQRVFSVARFGEEARATTPLDLELLIADAWAAVAHAEKSASPKP
jgi:hypothetical protein